MQSSRALEAARRAAMAKLVDVRVVGERDEALRTTLTFLVQNKTSKPIEGIETTSTTKACVSEWRTSM